MKVLVISKTMVVATDTAYRRRLSEVGPHHVAKYSREESGRRLAVCDNP